MGRSYPPANVRSAAWYLVCVALMAVPVYFLIAATVSETPAGAVAAAPTLGRVIAAAIGLIVISALLYLGFRLTYPVVMLLLVVSLVLALIAPDRQMLEVLVPVPALLLLLSPSAVSWFLGLRKRVIPVVEEREFHLPQR